MTTTKHIAKAKGTPSTTWKVTDNGGIETEAGETILCGQVDWARGRATTYIAKEHLGTLLAAPDMLEALEVLADEAGRVEGASPEAIEKARAAIAKAKGTP